MEFDHCFICVKPGALEAEAFKEFGLTEGLPNQHPGQGTASRRFFFHNAFIELLWLEDAQEAKSETTQPTLLYERLTADHDEVSPFGVCFRPTNANEHTVPFPSWRYKPVYLPSDLEINIAEGAPLSEPMWFYLSFGSSPGAAPKQNLQPRLHSAGVAEITSVRIAHPKSNPLSAPASFAAQSRIITFVAGTTYFLEIGFDHEVKGYSHSFMPMLPLAFKW